MKSRFSNLLADKLTDQSKAQDHQPKTQDRPAKKKAQKAKPTVKASAAAVPIAQGQTQEITIRRAVGKRSKNDYTQVSAYIPKDIHKKVKAALIDEERDFSELVSDLLAEWLRGRD